MTVLVDHRHRCQVKRSWRFGLAKHTAGSCDTSSLKKVLKWCVLNVSSLCSPLQEGTVLAPSGLLPQITFLAVRLR